MADKITLTHLEKEVYDRNYKKIRQKLIKGRISHKRAKEMIAVLATNFIVRKKNEDEFLNE